MRVNIKTNNYVINGKTAYKTQKDCIKALYRMGIDFDEIEQAFLEWINTANNVLIFGDVNKTFMYSVKE